MSLPLLCSFVLQCPGFSGTVFRVSWRIWVPSAFFSRCMVWVILMHRLTAWLWYHSLNASQEHLLLLPPAPLGASVLLGSRLIWFPPHPLCASAFLSWLLCDSFCFLGSRLLWVPPLIVFFCASVSRLLWDSFLGVLANSSTDFPYKQSHCFLIFLTGKPIISTFSDKNPKESRIFLARFFLCPFFLLGIRGFSKFLVGKVRTCIYLPPPTILGRFPNRIPDRISSDLGKSQIGTWQEKWES